MLIESIDVELWLTSSRRTYKELIEFNEIFKNRLIIKQLTGMTPIPLNRTSRLNEINTFLDNNSPVNFLIIDDDNSLQELEADRKKYWIKTEPLIGFDKNKMNEANGLIMNWC